MDTQTAPDDRASPPSPSGWRRMNLKMKILALAGPVAVAAAFAHNMMAPPEPAPASPKAFAAVVGPAQAAKPSAVLAAPALALASKATLLPSQPSGAPKAQSQAQPKAQPAVLIPATASAKAPAPDALAKALEGVAPNSRAMSKALSDVDLFASMATAVENFEELPYYDPGGLNVGMGYCVTKRLSEYGKERVAQDLRSAGFDEREVSLLVQGRDRKAIAKIRVTPLQAVRLIDATREDYMGLARDAVGDSFDKMPQNRQVALGYLAYNTGDVGKFRKLVSALRGGDDASAMRNMTVKWRDNQGELHANHRLRSYVQAMFLGASHFKRAIADPMAFEGNMASAEAESALADIAGAAQKPGALGSKLLARRMQANPWAFKALSAERDKASTPSQPHL